MFDWNLQLNLETRATRAPRSNIKIRQVEKELFSCSVNILINVWISRYVNDWVSISLYKNSHLSEEKTTHWKKRKNLDMHGFQGELYIADECLCSPFNWPFQGGASVAVYYHCYCLSVFMFNRDIWATSWQNQQNDLCAQRRLRSAWHKPSLIRVFAVRTMDSWGPNVSSCGQRRLWSDWADAQADLSLRWAHRSFCWF